MYLINQIFTGPTTSCFVRVRATINTMHFYTLSMYISINPHQIIKITKHAISNLFVQNIINNMLNQNIQKQNPKHFVYYKINKKNR